MAKKKTTAKRTAKKVAKKTTKKPAKKATPKSKATSPKRPAGKAPRKSVKKRDILKERADRHRDQAARRSRERYSADAELGELPLPVDPERRSRCEFDLQEFIYTYTWDDDFKPLCDEQQSMIAFMQDCILNGGYYAQAMPRGFAKTMFGILAIVWAILYHHRRYIVLFGYDKGFAEDLLEDVKTILSGESHELLEEDFPEIILPLRALEGNANRAKSQKFDGQRTKAIWKTTQIQTPTINRKEYSAVGVFVIARSKDNARGLRKKLPDGKMQRPDLFLADDVQSDGSAESEKLVEKLLSYIRKSWMLLAGHHSKGAGMINGTIIKPGDAMDQLTNPKNKLYAVWQSQRIRLVEKWPDKHDDLWLDKYADLRSNYAEGEVGAQKRAQAKADAFYQKNRKAMDAGSHMTWEGCYQKGDLSATQHAYNLLLDLGEEAFACECQNDPPQHDYDYLAPVAEIIIVKQHGLGPCVAPAETIKIAGYIDQQDKLLYWLVAAFCDGLTGYILDYGSYPAQKRRYFSLSNAKQTLVTQYPNMAEEARLHLGLTNLSARLFSREFRTPGGSILRLDRLGVDTNYGKRTKTIREWADGDQHRPSLVAGFGRGLGAKDRPMSEWPSKSGETRGNEWLLRRSKDSSVQTLLYDTNYHKKHAIDGLSLPLQTPGCMSLPKADPAVHKMFADHICSEFGILVKANDREVLEFEHIPNKDNHLLDCFVGARVIASTLGVRSVGERSKPKQRSRKTRKSRSL